MYGNAPLPGSRATDSATMPPLTLPRDHIPGNGPKVTFSTPPPPMPQPVAQAASSIAPSPIIAPAGAQSESAQSMQPVTQSPSSPPAFAAAPGAALGLPTANEVAQKPQLFIDLGPTKSIIAVVLTVLLVIGAIAGGIYLMGGFSGFGGDSNASADLSSSAANAPSAPDSKASLDTNRPPLTPKLSLQSPEMTAQSEGLVGYWVSRADDGSMSIFHLRPDGVVVFTPATGELDTATIEGQWALNEMKDGVATIDIVSSATGLEVTRLTMSFGRPDCFTVIRSVYRGVVDRPQQRFVRQSPPS
jgi:hypothetical protein